MLPGGVITEVASLISKPIPVVVILVAVVTSVGTTSSKLFYIKREESKCDNSNAQNSLRSVRTVRSSINTLNQNWSL